MYENQIQAKMMAAQGLAQSISDVRHNPTLAQNIDQRIAMLEEQVDRLNRVKALLAEPAGLLNVPVDDLRFALSY